MSPAGWLSLTSLICGSAALTCLDAGRAQASISCTFSSIGSCNTSVGQLTFSDFTLTNAGTPDGIDGQDTITISQVSANIYSINSSYNAIAGVGPLASPTGQYSFKASASGGDFISSAALDSTTLPGGNFTFTYTLTPSAGSPITLISAGTSVGPSSFTSTPLTSDVVVSWANSDGIAFGSTLFLYLNNEPQPVPAPLPLAGAAAMYSVSRRLRQRVRHGTGVAIRSDVASPQSSSR